MRTRWLVRQAAAIGVALAMALPLASSASASHRPRRRPGPPATYAIGDSVLIDAESVLHRLVPKLTVNAVVSRQFGTGLEIVEHLRATHRLTTRFVLFLGTNGYIEPQQFTEMLHELDVCKRVVIVTLWVPTRVWMRPNNDLLRTGPRRDHHAVIADWTALARAHPGWFYADQVHLPEGGPGATALAKLIASKLR